MGVLYYGDGRWVHDMSARIGTDLVAMAGELGQPLLGPRMRIAARRTHRALRPRARLRRLGARVSGHA